MESDRCQEKTVGEALTCVVRFLLTPGNQWGTKGNYCLLDGMIDSMGFDALSLCLSFSAQELKTQSKIIGNVVWITV